MSEGVGSHHRQGALLSNIGEVVEGKQDPLLEIRRVNLRKLEEVKKIKKKISNQRNVDINNVGHV